MGRDKVGDQDKLREMLLFFLEEMGATQLELSKGMGVSRPLVIDFLSEKKESLPVTSEGLVKLCEKLKSDKASKRKLKKDTHEDTVITPNQLRKELGKIGADELLESAGFLPAETQSIRVTPERFFHVGQIVALLELLEFEDLLSTTQEFLTIAGNKLTIASTKLFSDSPLDEDALNALIEKLWEPHPTLGLKLKMRVIKKLEAAQKNLHNGGKNKFSRKEAIALFLSILIKERTSHDTSLHARIKKLEFQTLSRSIDYTDEYHDVYSFLEEIAFNAEYKLQTPGLSLQEASKTRILDSLQPVVMAIATCSFGDDSDNPEPLEWIYTSSNTMVENAISACTLNMGLKEDTLLTISTNTLDSNIHSLVETTVILGDKQQYQGIWVGRDSMIVMLQAIVCAVKQWFGDKNRNNEIDSEIYISACRNLSELRKRLSIVRKAFHNFQFLDERCQLSEIKKIAEEAKKHFSDIPPKDIYFTYRLTFYRFYCLAKRLELRLSIFQGNVINAKYLIEELKEAIEKIDFQLQVNKNEISPIEALIRSEIYLYELSCGQNPEFFQDNCTNNWLELKEWKYRIRGAINTNSYYKDAGLDVYESLSEIHGNAARIYFYISQNRKTLEQAADNFLKAAYYALRIGLIQRVARWIALAGRVWVRLGDSKLSLQALKLSEKLAKTDLTTGHSHNFCQAVLSETSLLKGEYLLLIEDNAVAALDDFIQALKGSTYLGLNRRICDSLFNISRCSEKLGHLSIKEGLNRVFPEAEKLVEVNKKKLNPISNNTSEKVLDLLCDLYSREDNPTWFQVRDEFSTLAAEIWQRWHQDTSQPGVETTHPIAERIKNETWLSQID
ncbi:hypothetical protein [Rivularia sp. UHCC 0363]|uniref:hypothetical protein n=1 Tax=Rivularia sp. UHCC 0363 TaxID=3110244 RepID=UPI002B1FF79C|nr:hypothetical protein [Rivularia sp. UHCC 0363]MEA5595124.1 hypothetical protein [Rivularia sp. UHCC 0363]